MESEGRMGPTFKVEKWQKREATVTVPGSKSYTQRALVIASLAAGTSVIRDALLSEDTFVLMEALGRLGAVIERRGNDLVVTGTAGAVACPPSGIDVGNNGTALRLVMGVAALGRGPFRFRGTQRLHQRPVAPLAVVLAGMGAVVRYEGKEGCPPLTLEAAGLEGGRAVFGDLDSSQYVSAVMIAAPYARRDVEIEMAGSVTSRPYLAMTKGVMEAFGVRVSHPDPRSWLIPAGRPYRPGVFAVEGDASSASYFLALAPLCGAAVVVTNLPPRTLQGDAAFLGHLGRLGCRVEAEGGGVAVIGGPLPGGEMVFDMGDTPDLVPTLAVVAACREGRTVIENAAHLRIKESDRLKALATELKKTGVSVWETPDGLVIEGGRPHGAEIETYDDHRIAMSFAALGMATGSMVIRDPSCVAKSFPSFWETLGGLR